MKIASMLVAMLAACAVGCGQSVESQQDYPAAANSTGATAPQLTDADIPPVDWDNPISGAETSLDAAQKDMPFEIVVPANLGTPSRVLEAGLTYEPKSDFRAVALVYDTNRYGRVDVIEHAPSLSSLDEYLQYEQSLASLTGTKFAIGSADIVQLKSGDQALLTAVPDKSQSTINWYVPASSGDYEIIIRGPKLTPDQATEIANGV